ncbi:MAG: thiamine phosphate synthase [Vicinamibacterales bacterium]
MARPDPLLLLVTDRLRLARAVGAGDTDAPSLLLEQVRGAVAAGVDVVQVRERDLESGALAALVGAAVALAAGSRTRVVVNDRADVAIASGAAGVHLREDSIPTAAARRLLGAGAVVGRSVHDAAGAEAAGPVSYLLFGAVFETASKPGATPAGTEGLARVVAAAGGRPVLALGGITAANVGTVLRAGAAGVASIGAFLPAAGGGDNLVSEVKKMAFALRKGFDSAGSVP